MGAGSAPPAMPSPAWPPPRTSTCWVSGRTAGWGCEKPRGAGDGESVLKAQIGWWVGNPWDDGWRAEALGSSSFFTFLQGPDHNPSPHPSTQAPAPT